MPVIEIKTFQDFEDILTDKINHKKKYIFCDFYATWCGPCKQFAPTLDKLSEQYKKNIYYIKLNIETIGLEDLPKKYNITSLPTFMVFEIGSLESTHKPIQGANKFKVENKLKQLDEGLKRNEDF